MGHKKHIDSSSKWEGFMGETKVFCKKHRDTPIKFVENTDGIRDYKYYCPKCEQEKRRQ